LEYGEAFVVFNEIITMLMMLLLLLQLLLLLLLAETDSVEDSPLSLTVLPHGVDGSNDTVIKHWEGGAAVIPSARVTLNVRVDVGEKFKALLDSRPGWESDRDRLQVMIQVRSLRPGGKEAALTTALQRQFSVNVGEGGPQEARAEVTFDDILVASAATQFTIAPLALPHLFGATNVETGEDPGAPPAHDIPAALERDFLMDYQIPLHRYYWDDKDAEKSYPRYSRQAIDGFVSKIAKREEGYYGATDSFLYQAFHHHPIAQKKVLIVGSNVPFYEAMCLFFNASLCWTLEYNELRYVHPDLHTTTVAEWGAQRAAGAACDWLTAPANCKFDAVISISSLEHDGLGRCKAYLRNTHEPLKLNPLLTRRAPASPSLQTTDGDPLNPDGDLDAMQSLRNILQPSSGLLYLAVPIGKDALYWNEGRIYGAIRLPKLLAGFTPVSAWGVPLEGVSTGDEVLLSEALKRSQRMAPNELFQPVIILART
jgi:hypothetical protein